MSLHLGILTSGGDCAGLNAVIHAAVLRAHALGHRITGLEYGTAGLMEDPPRYRTLTPDNIERRILRQGGTIIGTTNNRNPFAYPLDNGGTEDRSAIFIDALRKIGVDALIGIGGDGSFAILSKLADQGGIPFIGVPKTIDNDVARTEFSVGFDTAVETATQALDHLQPTAASHDRIMILEVMGRDAGHIALHAGIAGGADIVLIPEIPFTMNALKNKIQDLKAKGRNFALMVVSEAVQGPDGKPFKISYADGQSRYGGAGHMLGDALARETGSETRVTVLGHIQRGGEPTHNDRLMASAFGVHAVDLADQGKFGRMVAWHNRQVIDVALDEILDKPHRVDPKGPLVHTARSLGISFGDDTSAPRR